jgi:hypothetical protein
MLMGIDHLVIVVNDLQQAARAAVTSTREALKTVSRERLVDPDFFRRVFTI